MLDTSAGGILPVLPEGMIHPVVSASHGILDISIFTEITVPK
jgi:hypothetical protein